MIYYLLKLNICSFVAKNGNLLLENVILKKTEYFLSCRCMGSLFVLGAWPLVCPQMFLSVIYVLVLVYYLSVMMSTLDSFREKYHI